MKLVRAPWGDVSDVGVSTPWGNVPSGKPGRGKGEGVLAYSTGVFNTLKFVHIVAAIIWVGAGLFFQFQSTRLKRANDAVNLARFAADVGFWGTRLLMPASLTVLVMGVVMAVTVMRFLR